MKSNLITLSFLPLVTAALTAGSFAHAQNAASPVARKVQQDAAVCLGDISRFEQTLTLVRKSNGEKSALELKEKLLPASREIDILTKEGYCGLAKHLRDKKLI